VLEALLERRLFRRQSTGAAIDYDVLRGLEYLRRAGVTPDERVTEAIELVESKRAGDGRWPLEVRYPGEMPAEPVEHAARLTSIGLVFSTRLRRRIYPGILRLST
jgi:hypothetical protein